MAYGIIVKLKDIPKLVVGSRTVAATGVDSTPNRYMGIRICFGIYGKIYGKSHEVTRRLHRGCRGMLVRVHWTGNFGDMAHLP